MAVARGVASKPPYLLGLAVVCCIPVAVLVAPSPSLVALLHPLGAEFVQQASIAAKKAVLNPMIYPFLRLVSPCFSRVR